MLRDWIRFWLVCLALVYPLTWTASIVVSGGPALIRAAVFHHKLERFDANYLGASMITRPPWGSQRQGFPRRAGAEWLAETALVVLAAVALLGVLGRRHRAISGLAAALLGQAALAFPAATLLFARRFTLPAAVGLALFFAVLCAGLRWMLQAAPAQGYWARTGTLLAAFVLPSLALPWLFYGWNFGQPILALPAAVAALLASLAPAGARKLAAPAAKTAIVGLAASLALVAAVRQQNAAVQRARAAAHQAAMARIPALPPNLPYPKVFFQKGVNFTSEFPNIYGSEGSRKMLGTLPPYGIDAVALVPYGFASRGSPRLGFPGGMEPDDGIEELAAVAHSLGMKVLLKPHLWVRGGYPGDLEFAAAADRAQWFEQYTGFVEHYARLAKKIHADVFCVGLEFAKLYPYDAEWRKVIARARAIYPGPLAYAASSGPEFENIAFWDALDYIGLNEYYSLSDDLSMEAVVQKVESIQRKYNRPVLFTEAGFSSYEKPNREPWDDKPRKLSPEDQARCYEAVFRAFYGKPWFQGIYWWKVGTSGRGGPDDGSHSPWGKPAIEVVKRWFLRDGR